MKKQIKGGLRLTPKDPRNFKFGAIYAIPKLSDLPPSLFVSQPLTIKDQGPTDMCQSFALSSVLEDHENVELDPGYIFNRVKKLNGDPEAWGADLLTTVKVAVKFGALEGAVVSDRDTIVKPDTYPTALDQKAIVHSQKAYFEIDSPYDTFDTFRAVLYANAAERRSIITGVAWRNEWTYAVGGIIPTAEYKPQFGHAFKVFGYKQINGQPYLVAQLSQGKGVGDHGLFYFPREVVNRDFVYGGFTLQDIDRATAEYYLQYGIMNNDNWLTQTIKVLSNIIKSAFGPFSKLTPVEKETILNDVNNVVTTMQPKYLWDTPANVRHSIRVICDEEGLTLYEKNVITACIQQESAFNPKAVSPRNKNGTRDWGLCQYNDGKIRGVPMWIGPGSSFQTTDEVLNNPEKCVRLMIKMFRAGHMNWWVSYSSGAYLQFMPK